MEVVLSMRFLIFTNVGIQFAEKKLIWKTYIIKETLPNRRQIKLIDQKKFAKVALDENIKAFIVYVRSLEPKINIYLARKAQMALLLAEKVTVLAKYSDFADVFLKELANVFLEQTRVNKHTIELEKGKQPPYGPIYSLRPVEFKTFKIYIKTSLANSFIKASKSPVGAPILFVHKPDSSFYFYIDYQGLNNLMIKNWYLLPLISKSLDWLG